jgi:hypothetical protein
MEAGCDNSIPLDQDGADGRIGADMADAFPRFRNCRAHELFVGLL